MIRVIELFAGIGAQAAALDRIGAEWESVGIVEIDPYCVTAYNAIHGTNWEPSDITKIEKLPECDLLTYSFPCTDISTAGKQKGLGEGSGTRSSLLWEVYRLLTAYTDGGGEPAEVPSHGKRQSSGRKTVQARLRQMARQAQRAGLHDLLESSQRDGLRRTAEQRTRVCDFDTARRRGIRIPRPRTPPQETQRRAGTRSRPEILHKRRCDTLKVGKQLHTPKPFNHTRGGGFAEP